MEHSLAEGKSFAPARYLNISHDAEGIAALFTTVFLETHEAPTDRIILDLDATDDPLHAYQEGRLFVSAEITASVSVNPSLG